MDMESSIQNVRRLFDEKKYIDVLEVSLPLLDSEDKKIRKEAYLLAIKSFLLSADDVLSEDNQNTVEGCVRLASEECDSVEEVIEMERDILGALQDCTRKVFKTQWENLGKKPTKEQWNKCNNIPKDMAFFEISIRMITRGCTIVKSYCESNNITSKEFSEKYKFPEGMSSEEQNVIRVETAQVIFDQTRSFIEQNKHSSAQFISSFLKDIVYRSFMVEGIVSTVLSLPGRDHNLDMERLKILADFYVYHLNTMLYPNGKTLPLAVASESRTSTIRDLKGVYNRIKRIDPDFVEPALPAENPITVSTSNNGGCYVATAVYGSYDCPQVWTLRRYRDETLAETWYGRAFVRLYYAVSPVLVKYLGDKDWFKQIWRGLLDRMVNQLNEEGVEDTPYNDKNW